MDIEKQSNPNGGADDLDNVVSLLIKRFARQHAFLMVRFAKGLSESTRFSVNVKGKRVQCIFVRKYSFTLKVIKSSP